MIVRSLVAALAVFGAMASSHAAVFTVDNYADDGSAGTLRWAITQNNVKPGGHTIQIVPAGAAPYVIKLDSLLPAIKGPVVIRGMPLDPAAGVPPVVTTTLAGLPAAVRGALPPAGVAATPAITIDGSNFINGNAESSCPGFAAGQFGINIRTFSKPALSVVDSGGVEISNIEIRSFCIGVLLHRSSDNHLHDLYIHNTSGAAGVMITGDSGDAGGNPTNGLSIRNLVEWNTIVDTGDGMECTRGTTFGKYQNNLLIETRTRGSAAPISQGIECAGLANNIEILNNVFIGFSDGLQLNDAANSRIEGNVITGVSYGITTNGAGNVFRSNLITGNLMGIGPTNAARATITQNSIYGNGLPVLALSNSAGGTTNTNSPAKLGIDIGVNGRSANDALDANTVQNFPVLSAASSWDPIGTPVLQGTLATKPNGSFRVEFFANRSLNVVGRGEGEIYLGAVTLATGVNGDAPFNFTVPGYTPAGPAATTLYFTATATNLVTGATSEFSDAIVLTRAPAACADLVAVRGAMGARLGDPRYIARVDLDRNGLIDVRDVAAISRLVPAGTVCN